jgi:aldose sugar dehydrogenase
MKKMLSALVLVLSSVTAYTQHYATRVIKDNLFIPWEIIYGPDDHIWFTQKNGYVCRLDPVTKDLDTLLHVTETVVNNEGGMLGMALHPDFDSSPYVYIVYEYNKGSVYTEKVVRYTHAGGILTSPMTLLDNIKGASIHNGSRLFIVDGKLFISTGDAATASNAQDLASLNGKILRINLDGSIPADNPIPGSPVWNWGQRNVQGMVFANDKLYSSMHGASNDDEINILVKGRNYGWPNVEGFCDKSSETAFCADSNVVEPLKIWSPTIAPAGLDYYDHPMFPDLRKSLIMATLKDSRLHQLRLNATYDAITTVDILDSVKAGRLRDLCISPNGSIFVSTSNSSASGTGAHVDKIIELYDPGFTHVPEQAIAAVSVTPNPSRDKISLRWNQALTGTGTYMLSGADGRVLLQGALEASGLTLDISGLPAGLYYLYCSHPDIAASVSKVMKY